MRIGILGAGAVGSTLGRAWANRGHQVAFATRNPDDPKLATLALSIGPNASAGAVPRVVEYSEVVVLATPWTAVRDMPGVATDWSGKILIDCTNPLRSDFTWLEDDYEVSGAERIAAWATGAAVFKTLNHTGANNMANPAYPGGTPVMFVCGDDAAAKPTVLKLVAELGFEAVDAGPLRVARLLEPLAMLWIRLAMTEGLGREIAFALLRRAGPAG
jgi:8-hydroxy-5-deazaflavin:NADPH oxidoreductase